MKLGEKKSHINLQQKISENYKLNAYTAYKLIEKIKNKQS